MTLRCLYLYAGPTRRDEAWVINDPMFRGRCRWAHAGIETDSSLLRTAHAFVLASSGHYDLIVTSEYFIAFGANLRLRLTAGRAKHLVWGLNQSRRLLKHPLFDWFINWVFNRADKVITHSRSEGEMFSRIHAIDSGKFRFAHWGFDLPDVPVTRFSDPARPPYACLVGRNNRDIQTFCAGLHAVSLRGVVITSGMSPTQADMIQRQWPGIEVHIDLSMGECLDCIRNSLFNAVLLMDDTRGAGHITLVSAMLMGKAQVITRARVVEDYALEDAHALMVGMGSASDFAVAAARLLDDATLRGTLGRNAHAFAQQYVTHRATSDRFVAEIDDMFTGESDASSSMLTRET